MKSRNLLQVCFLFVFISTLHAQTWTALTSGTTANLYGVYFTDANTGYAVGGGIYKTTNGGTSWASLNVTAFTGATFQAVQFSSATVGYVVGRNNSGGLIIKTTDAGVTWTAHTAGTLQSLRAVYYLNPNHQYASGTGGAIVESNGGSTWTAQTTGVSLVLSGIYFSDFNHGCAVGSLNTLIKTSNAGTTWTAATTPSGPARSWNAVAFGSGSTGYAVGSAGAIIKTIDSGSTWTAQAPPTTTELFSVSFVDVNNGYAVGTPVTSSVNVLLKTTNGGATWVNQTAPTTLVTLNGVYAVNANLAYVVGDGGKIFKTGTGTPILVKNRFSGKRATAEKLFDLRGRNLSLQNLWHGKKTILEWSRPLR